MRRNLQELTNHHGSPPRYSNSILRWGPVGHEDERSAERSPDLTKRLQTSLDRPVTVLTMEDPSAGVAELADALG